MQRKVFRAMVIVAILGASVLASGSAGAKPPAGAGAIIPRMSDTFSNLGASMQNVSEAVVNLIEPACNQVPRYGATQEQIDFLNRAATLALDDLDRDVRPGVEGNGNDYAYLSGQLERFGKEASGAARGELYLAALYTDKARQQRVDEGNYLKRAIDEMRSRHDCAAEALLNAAFGELRGAEKDEKLAVGSARQALIAKPFRFRRDAPIKFKITATITGTFHGVEKYGANGTCPDPGTGVGSITEKASFDPITVNPDNTISKVSNDRGPGTVSGTWGENGSYHPDGDCSGAPRSFSCNGGFTLNGGHASMIVVSKGTESNLILLLPAPTQTGTGSCPSGSDQNTEIPMFLQEGEVAGLYIPMTVPLNGHDLRARADTSTITDGILGGTGSNTLNPDCLTGSAFATSCSLAGSRATAQVDVEPVD